MKLTSTAAFTIALASSLVSAYPITGTTVNCRSGPGTNFDIKKTYKQSQDVSITCQTAGDDVSGNNIWDKTSDGCYVADYYVKTGSSGYVTKKCDAPAPPGGDSKIPGPEVNDYPYKSQCGPVDKWNYYKCQCTSFAAWRINDRLGIKFTNQFKGYNWGNANSWDEAARSTGVKINQTPVPGCIAQTNAGHAGHVAWVAKVSGDEITIEEYNYVHPEGYGTRTLNKSAFQNYIHLKV